MIKKHGSKILIVVAVAFLIGAWCYGKIANSGDVIEEYLVSVLPETSWFVHLEGSTVCEGIIYKSTDSNDELLGYITASEGIGYGGPMTVLIEWTPEGEILNLIVPEHKEDLPWWNDLEESTFFSQYIGRYYSEPLLLDESIDAVSGSTISCIGVSSGVHAGRTLFSEYTGDPYPLPDEPIDFGMGEITLLIGLGLVVCLRTIPSLKKLRWPRYFMLLFGFIVLGIWLTIPLSLTNIAAWLVGYTPRIETSLILYILVLGVIGLALISGKNFYCFWLCPFAAVQEGIKTNAVNPRLLPLSLKRILRKTRYLLLWLTLMLVFIYFNPGISVFEPWNVLFTLNGTMIQWVLLAAVLITAILIHNIWCRYLCPVGATLEIILKIRKAVVSPWRRK